MQFSLDDRTASLSVGEFSDFTVGPRDAGSGFGGIWRAQLGTHWHNELRTQTAAEHATAEFEIPITGRVAHQGWTITLTGRIDQIVRTPTSTTLREIKTVTDPLPADELTLRTDYPGYFAQLAAYVALTRQASPATSAAAVNAEFVFVETSSGLAQTVALTPSDDATFRAQLDRIAEFLNLRLRARERLRRLSYRPAFATLRPGQETTQAELTATFERNPLVFFEAPTGFGKTGVLLEFILGQLRAGHFDRALYLTSKSTGQLQVVGTLNRMAAAAPPEQGEGRKEQGKTASSSHRPAATSVAAWHVRNKAEHCVNHTFHCVRENCRFLEDLEARWPNSGLSRFYLIENQARDIATLRAAGEAARICPYEITRAALAFNDVWIGDYNYVFAPANRGLFYLQPGFDSARTLLVLDEAHNLPARVADAHSHTARANDATAVLAELDHIRAPAALVRAWESWAKLLLALRPTDALDPALEADVTDTLGRIADELAAHPLDYAALGPHIAELLWQAPRLVEWIESAELKKLLWCPRESELAFTCIDAADAIGATLRSYGGVVCASATFGPPDEYAEACGLKKIEAAGVAHNETKELATLVAEEPGLIAAAVQPAVLQAHTPWREGAYEVAVDARVDTTFQHRARHYRTTASTIAALHTAARGPVAVFFPSYSYAETISREVDKVAPLRVALQPRLHDLAAQTAWVDESLAFTDALFLVLGSSFAESIDLLGGRITHAMVVGPALPEVNAVQRARLAEFSPLGREHAFRRVYQIPGMMKVNQALGRLVRAPGHRARVLLHCRRFLEPSYASLLAREYQFGRHILEDADLAAWL